MSMRTKLPCPGGMRSESGDVLVRQLLSSASPRCVGFIGDVRSQVLPVDAVEHPLVLLHDRPCLRRLPNALAEQRRVRQQTPLVQRRKTGTAARTSPRRRSVGPEAQPVPPDECADRLALRGSEDRASRDRVDRVRDHCCRARGGASASVPRSRASRRAPSPPSPRRAGRRAASAAPPAADRDPWRPRRAIWRMASANSSSVSFASVSVGSIIRASGTTSGK